MPGGPYAFVATHEGLHVVIEGETEVLQIRVYSEEEAMRLAAKANRELGISDAEIDPLIERSFPKR